MPLTVWPSWRMQLISSLISGASWSASSLCGSHPGLRRKPWPLDGTEQVRSLTDTFIHFWLILKFKIIQFKTKSCLQTWIWRIWICCLLSLWITGLRGFINVRFDSELLCWTEILGVLLSVMSIWAVTAVLVLSAVQRITDGDYDIDSHIMLITSGCAVGVNILWVAHCWTLGGLSLSSGHTLPCFHSGWCWSSISLAPPTATATGSPPAGFTRTSSPRATATVTATPAWRRPSSTWWEICCRALASCWLPPSSTSGSVSPKTLNDKIYCYMRPQPKVYWLFLEISLAQSVKSVFLKPLKSICPKKLNYMFLRWIWAEFDLKTFKNIVVWLAIQRPLCTFILKIWWQLDSNSAIYWSNI